MAQEQLFINDIRTEHRERMVNLKKYYPFFQLCNTSLSQFREGRYVDLDMGYLMMAVLRFFIEKNNFEERDVTYGEYRDFLILCMKRDFDVSYAEEEYPLIAEYIFDRMKNDGRPFVYEYYDPADRKKHSLRLKLIESTIKDDVVWYHITSDAIEFYLDTKEIKDQSKISVQQLLLEKLIRAKNFDGGIQVISRINNEVSRLKYRKNEVVGLLAIDVFSGIEAYEDFVEHGMKWFTEEEKLFIKNMELIQATLERAEEETEKNEAYYRTVNEIYQLSVQLKTAMNKHSELLTACTELSTDADAIIRKAKLRKLRNGFDFRRLLSRMVEKDDVTLLDCLIPPLFGLHTRKSFPLTTIDSMLTLRPERKDVVEKDEERAVENIIFPDEVEEERMEHNFLIFTRILMQMLHHHATFTLYEYMETLESRFGADIRKHSDLYAFVVHLCQKKEYHFPESAKAYHQDTFLDGYIATWMSQVEGFKEELLDFTLDFSKEDGEQWNDFTITNFVIERVEA
ncbi:MAG: hypothetical protein K6C69_06815 [Lachnospiraceae bacterium]|nr:hypothetical protein [Lachnospiraceae bacterium]